MKTKKNLIIILIGLLIITGVEGMISFWSNHTYYSSMLLSWRNRGLFLSAGLAARIPVAIIISKKKLTLSRLYLGVGGGLSNFMVLHELLSGSLLSLFSIVPLIFNTMLLYTLAVVFFVSILGLGKGIAKGLKLFTQYRRQETLLSFGLGLGAFLLIMQLLMGVGILYSGITWLLVFGLIIVTRLQRDSLKEDEDNILSIFDALKKHTKGNNTVSRILKVLLFISLGYYFFNFSHSYIPYSTAWDANHEYMYIPKIIAENTGILRGNSGPGATMPYLRHGLISFFFSLRGPMEHLFSIAKDTVAVNINAFSGMLVLIFGLGAIKEGLRCFRKNKEEDGSPSDFLIGWGLLLLWLTSGMGSFLVFVDNKTDMGVLALTLLALLGGFIFLNSFSERRKGKNHKQYIKYLILSSIFFGFAVMAKPTAFIDVVVFGLLMVGLWMNSLILLGGGIATLGLMGVLQPLFTSSFLDKEAGILLLSIGTIFIAVGLVYQFIKQREDFWIKVKQLMLWIVIFVGTVFIFRGPRTAVAQVQHGTFQLGTFMKQTLLGANLQTKEHDEKKYDFSSLRLYAQANSIENLETQNTIDRADLNSENPPSPTMCKTQLLSPDELDRTKQKAPGSAMHEDIGRYIGFGWRPFKKTGIGGGILKLLFWGNDRCYGRDHDGILLCKNRELITKQNLSELGKLLPQLTGNGTAAGLLKELISKEKGGEDLRDSYTALETYYQEHSILTDKESVAIPYRYIVPLNVVFNRSLQNLSSYYTDIGLIWLCIFLIMLFGVISTLILKKNNKKELLSILLASVLGWIIWRAIAGGIVWYGLGLIVWSILSAAAVIEAQEEKENTDIHSWYHTLLWIIGIFMAIQLLLNGVRIASQATGGPFGRYKSNVGEKQVFSDTLEYQTKKTSRYTAKDIFRLQFGQYEPFIEEVAKRADEDGVLIAGTYLQYFLNNQKNLRLDGMLTWLWEEVSDFDSCRSYQRLKNEKLKYLVIDPNIGTVGRVGDGNESLFYRFFARLSADEKNIQTHGAITMLVKMAQEGYLKLLYSNNIGAKYGFNLSDSELQQIFTGTTAEDMTLLRSKLVVAKFFYDEPEILEGIFTLFQQRIINGQGIGDIANILGKNIDEEKLLPFVSSFLSGKPVAVTNLSQDERLVLAQYLGLYNLLGNGNIQKAQEALGQLFQNSVLGSSQIIALKLK